MDKIGLEKQEKKPILDSTEDESSLFDDNLSEEPPVAVKSNRSSAKRNILILSVSILFIFTAFQALQSLQSSLNATGGKGVACLAVLYGFMCISSLLLAPVLLGILRPKWTLAICFVCHCLFTASNFYPQWYSLIPACALLGAASGPLWAAESTYLTTLAVMHAAAVKEKEEAVIQQFNGIFFAIFQASVVGGNLASSLVFTFANEKNRTEMQESSESCSVNTSLCVLDRTKYTLFSVFEMSGIIGLVLLIVALKTLKQLGAVKQERRKALELAASVVKFHKDVKVLLLIPIVFYTGLEQAFFAGEYTKYFVSDLIGIEMVGFVMIVYGVVDSISSYVSGKLCKKIGRFSIILSGGLLNIGIVISLLVWIDCKRHPTAVLFTAAALWGVVDAISNTQTVGLFGVLFTNNQEAAFGAYRLWQSVGFVVSFAYSDALKDSLDTKLYIILGVLCISMVGYIAMEIVRKKFKV